MCGWMLWGGAQYFVAECASAGGAGALDVALQWAQCNAWLAWVMLNAGFHLFWVSVLTCCQLYLVSAAPGRSRGAGAAHRCACAGGVPGHDDQRAAEPQPLLALRGARRALALLARAAAQLRGVLRAAAVRAGGPAAARLGGARGARRARRGRGAHAAAAAPLGVRARPRWCRGLRVGPRASRAAARGPRAYSPTCFISEHFRSLFFCSVHYS